MSQALALGSSLPLTLGSLTSNTIHTPTYLLILSPLLRNTASSLVLSMYPPFSNNTSHPPT